jgi:hypothetical protein
MVTIAQNDDVNSGKPYVSLNISDTGNAVYTAGSFVVHEVETDATGYQVTKLALEVDFASIRGKVAMNTTHFFCAADVANPNVCITSQPGSKLGHSTLTKTASDITAEKYVFPPTFTYRYETKIPSLDILVTLGAVIGEELKAGTVYPLACKTGSKLQPIMNVELNGDSCTQIWGTFQVLTVASDMSQFEFISEVKCE